MNRKQRRALDSNARKFKAARSADFDQGLETCKAFVRNQPQTAADLPQVFQGMMDKDQDPPTQIVGAFAMLGLLCTIQAIPAPGEETQE